jgi:hypothetical protein
MKLTKLERRVLCFIQMSYPVPWDKAEANAYIAIGERPLPTLQGIAKRFPTAPTTQLGWAIKKLLDHQYVKKIDLWPRDAISDMTVAPGVKLRSVHSMK